MKKMLLVVLFATSIATITIAYQWWNHSDESRSGTDKMDSAVTIKASEKTLLIRQTFDSYQPGTYSIDIPEGAQNVTCAPVACESAEQLKMMENTPSVSYELPISSKIEDWTIGIEGSRMTYELSLRDTTFENRTFAMATPPEAMIERERVHYYKWADVPDSTLYMIDSREKQRYSNEHLTILHEPGQTLEGGFVQRASSLAESYGEYLLFLDEEENAYTADTLHLRARETDTLEELLFRKDLANRMNERDHWVVLMYAALFFDTELPQAEERAAPLAKAFTVEEIAALKESFKQWDGKDAVRFSDELLSSMRRGKTTYTRRLAEGRLAEFYYTVPKVSVSGKEFMFVTYRERLYVPLSALREDEAFSVTMLSEDSFLLETDDKRVRLSLGKETYIQNEADFGIAEGAVKRFEGKLFLQEQFMNDVLDLHLGIPEDIR